MADNRTGNVIKNSWASLFERFIQIAVQFALRTAFIKLLGNEYTGIAGLFTDILHVLSLMELGLDSSMIYSLYDPLARKDTNKISALLKFYKTAFTVIGVTVFIAGLGCTPFLQYIVKGVPNISEDIRVIFMLYVSASAASYFLIYKSVLLRADQKARIISKWSIIVSVSECIAEIIALFIFRQFYAYLIVHLIATVGKNAIISRVSTNTYKEYFADNGSRLTGTEKKKLFRDLACITVYNLSGVVINSTDSIFISAFVGTVEVAIIGNFTLIITGIRTAVNQIINATKPSIGNLAATSDAKKQEEIFVKMNFIAFWVSCICCTCLFTLLNPFVGDIWLSESYKISIAIVAVMVINFYIAVMVFPVESFRIANGLFIQGWMRPAIMAVMNILLDYFWGKRWGIIGIFVATTVSRVLTQVWYDPWLVYSRVFGTKSIQYFMKYIYYAVVIAGSCAIANWLCVAVSIEQVYLAFLVKLIISLVIPNLIVFILFGRSEDFKYAKSLGFKVVHKIMR